MTTPLTVTTAILLAVALTAAATPDPPPTPFTPTCQWQTVDPSVALPPGLQIRMDLATPDKHVLARLPDASCPPDPSGRADPATVRAAPLVAVPPPSPPAWPAEDAAALAAATRMIDSLNAMGEDIDRIEILKAATALLAARCPPPTSSTPLPDTPDATSPVHPDLELAFATLDSLAHHVDSGADLFTLGVGPPLVACIRSPHPPTAAAALLLTAALAQNNAAAQDAAVAAGVLDAVVAVLADTLAHPAIGAHAAAAPLSSTAAHPISTAKRALAALSALLRSSPPVQLDAVSSGILGPLVTSFLTAATAPPLASPVHPGSVAGRILALVDDIYAENSPDTIAALLPALSRSGWCAAATALADAAAIAPLAYPCAQHV